MAISTTADIAVIILVIHALILVIVPLVLAYFLTRGTTIANRKTRQTMPIVQEYARRMAQGAEDVSQQIAAPIIQVETTIARWRGAWRQATSPLRRSPPQPPPPWREGEAAGPVSTTNFQKEV